MKRASIALLMLAGCHHDAPRTGNIYVSDETTNAVHVIDAATLTEVSRIATGRRPRGMTFSPDRRSLYVAVGDDSRIDVIDLALGKATARLPSGPDPETIAISPDGQRLYIANENDNRLSVVDVGAGKLIDSVAVGGEPEGTAVSPDGKLVIQCSETAGMAHVIDRATGRVIDNLMVDTRPRHVAFTRDGRQFWVSSEVRATVTIFDTAARRRIGKIDFEQLIPGERSPDDKLQAVAIGFTRDGGRAFVALGRGKLVAEVDPRSFGLIRTFPVGWRAWNLALSPDDSYLYTANGLSRDLTAIDLVNNRVAGNVRLGGKPWGVLVR